MNTISTSRGFTLDMCQEGSIKSISNLKHNATSLGLLLASDFGVCVLDMSGQFLRPPQRFGSSFPSMFQHEVTSKPPLVSFSGFLKKETTTNWGTWKINRKCFSSSKASPFFVVLPLFFAEVIATLMSTLHLVVFWMARCLQNGLENPHGPDWGKKIRIIPSLKLT